MYIYICVYIYMYIYINIYSTPKHSRIAKQATQGPRWRCSWPATTRAARRSSTRNPKPETLNSQP